MGTLFSALDIEWRRFQRNPSLNTRYPDALALAGNSTGWDQAQHWMRTADPIDADRVLNCLVSHAIEPDKHAARIVMALLMPGMVCITSTIPGDTHDREQLIAGAVWERIATYPLDARPRRIARNILLDARRLATPQPERDVVPIPWEQPRHPQDDQPVPQPTAEERLSAGEELLRLLRDRVHSGHLEPEQAQLIARIRVAGEPLRDVAATEGVGLAAISLRCRKAEAYLACVA